MSLATCLVALVGCTDVMLEPQVPDATHVSAELTLRGRVCTSAPDPTGFPVKVVLVVDQSGSMCISDPPGSQGGSGFCEQLVADGIVPPGLTEPARVRALKRLVAQFAQNPNVQLSVVPFETNVRNVWPASFSGARFARPDASLDTYISLLQSQLGKGTDYQGALAYAYGLISSDIQDVSANNPALLPRSRYVVVFLTDGTPYPRCSANDNLSSYAGPDAPWGTWADTFRAEEFCNLLDPASPDAIDGFVVGTDRNQNYQLFNHVDRLMQLEEQYNIGDIRMHTVLLFNEQAVQACGAICQEIYGAYPGVPVDQFPAAAHTIAAWTLQQLAERGNGVFQEFLDGDIQNLGLGALDYSSLASPFVLKRLMLQSLSSVPYLGDRAVDSDGDGLPDELDNAFTCGTSPYSSDSDSDCFDDAFEQRRRDRSFFPEVGDDPRSCGMAGGGTCVCADGDGDGLSQFGETFLTTRHGLVDSDADGVPDGLEARYRLDPVSRDVADLDTDADGTPDLDEFLAQTDPTHPDRELFERDGYQYELRAFPQADGRTCYDYAIRNVRMVSPPARAGFRQGYNRFKVWFAEAPASGVSSDYGVWKAACASARYAPPTVRAPVGPEIWLGSREFWQLDDPQDLDEEGEYLAACVGAGP